MKSGESNTQLAYWNIKKIARSYTTLICYIYTLLHWLKLGNICHGYALYKSVVFKPGEKRSGESKTAVALFEFFWLSFSTSSQYPRMKLHWSFVRFNTAPQCKSYFEQGKLYEILWLNKKTKIILSHQYCIPKISATNLYS